MSTIAEERPGTPGLRERKKQQTREAIHEAAYRLIDAQGFEATTIDQICQEAEVSSRTFFNYFPSKAAAALQIPDVAITDDARATFRAAQGGLVDALCDAIGSSTDVAPRHARIKALLKRHPELITTMSQAMLEMRGQFVALAAERARSSADAELAVAVVMAAMGRVMHESDASSETLTRRLQRAVAALRGVIDEQMAPVAH